MDTQRWELAGNIFERLLGTPQDQRNTMLESLCGEDAELKRVVASMLDSESSALHFEQGLGVKRAAAGTDTTADIAPPPTAPVGPWRLVRKIGSGGMGVVWLAERADGQFEQRAALKLIKRGMDSEAVLKRFLRERQILARLDHPHIAHLLDGGIAADGSPYFAMEYVEGLPLLQYCYERAAKLEERIMLFLDICAAVQFAHSQHVVHRDLKPSNILVTANAGVKLLDFGIAKLLESQGGDAETLTHQQHEQPMTPAYAAPEQIRGGKISEATDVYALGCVLYELLTGQRVRDFSGAADMDEVLRILESTDPVAPSRLKLATTPVPGRRLRGDLDTIVLTALKRDPERRYASADAFGADLRNYLDGKPISARRDHVLYRGYKFLRRHRVGVAMSAAMALIALAATAFVYIERQPHGFAGTNASLAIVDFNNLTHNKDATWIAPALAQMLATDLAQGSKLHALPDELVRNARADLAPPLAGGYAPASLAILRKRVGADYVLSGSYLVSGAAQADAKLRLDIAVQDARSGTAIANVAQSGVMSDMPLLVDRAGAELREKLGYATVSANTKVQVERAQPPNTDVARHMGVALEAMRSSDAARAKGELLDAIAQAPGYAPAYVLLAQAWKMLGYDAKALAAAQQAAANSQHMTADQRLRIEHEVAAQKAQWPLAIELDRKLLAANRDSIEVRLDLIDDLLAAGKPDDAQAMLDEVRTMPEIAGDPRIELKAARIADARGDTTAQARHAQEALQQAQARDELALMARARQTLASARDALGQRDQAETLIREAITDYQHTGNPHGEADARVLLAIIHGEQNQSVAEREEYQHALDIYQRIGDQGGIALVYRNLLAVLWTHGDRDGAETAGKRALEIFRETGNLKGQVEAQTTLAVLQMDEAADDATMDSFKQAIDLSELSGDRGRLVDTLNRYAEGLRRRGALAQAQDVCKRVIGEATQLADPSGMLAAENACASTSRDQGNTETAIAAFMRARAIATRLGDSKSAARIDIKLAQIDIMQSHWVQAVERLGSATAASTAAESIVDESSGQSLLALCYQSLQRSADRDSAAARAKALRSRVTVRFDALITDMALAQLRGEMGEPRQAADALLALADDAQKRQWLAEALEARFAALSLLDDAHDPAAPPLRARLETDARQHGFDGLLARMGASSKSAL